MYRSAFSETSRSDFCRRTIRRGIACLLLAPAVGAAQMPFIESVSPPRPDCVMRFAADPARRTIELRGRDFPNGEGDVAVQFAKFSNGQESQLLGQEIDWVSPTTVQIDMARINHLFPWAEGKVEVAVRFARPLSVPPFLLIQPLSTWSPSLIIADDEAACQAPDPPPPPLVPRIGEVQDPARYVSRFPPDTPFEVRVYVVDYEPQLDGQPLSMAMGWNDPDLLTQGYVHDVHESSGGVVEFRIVRWARVAGYPPKVHGGFGEAEYRSCITPGADISASCWDEVDYREFLNTRFEEDFPSACDALASNLVDEVWVWGGPSFGFLEFGVFPPSSSFCREASRTFSVMGFNYERTVAEMLHDLGHRAEALLNLTLGPELWNLFDGQRDRHLLGLDCNDERTSAEPIVGHCGDTHLPPNARCEYEYWRDHPVLSDCDDWINFPDRRGTVNVVNSDQWGADMGGYHRWWLAHLPHNAGESAGVAHDWWRYVFFQNLPGDPVTSYEVLGSTTGRTEEFLYRSGVHWPDRVPPAP